MPVLIPTAEPWASDDMQLLALCVWRESRSESLLAKIGVAKVILNRCSMAPAQGFKHDVRGNILHPGAFSSFLAGDPNSVKYPEATDPSWKDSLLAADSTITDPTDGAVFYFSPPLTAPPAAWGPVRHTVTFGGLHFYVIA